MPKFDEIKKLLNSKELYFECSLASDFKSLRKRLNQQEAVTKLNEFLYRENELDKIINYVNTLIKKAEEGKRINDIAICCCIFVLAQIPMAETSLKNFIHSLVESPIPALRWVSNFTRYCRLNSQITFTGSLDKRYQPIKKGIEIASKAKSLISDDIIDDIILKSSGGYKYA